MSTKKLLAVTLLALVPALTRADVKFTFNQVGSDVVMTSSGTLDTTKLVETDNSSWGGIGVETNGVGDIDIMGSTLEGPVNLAFAFHMGTNISAWVNPFGPFAQSVYSGWVATEGVKSFATFAGFSNDLRVAGISLVAADVVDGFWTPDQQWTNAGSTLASLGLNTGVYSIVDGDTGETITIEVGAAPGLPSVPDNGATIGLLGLSLAGLALLRRRDRV